ncbi:hypothetical protein V2G26_016590 [Clonostachys chloroleuca]
MSTNSDPVANDEEIYYTSLLQAASDGNEVVLKEILSKQSFRSFSSDDILRRALQEAAGNGSIQCVRLLIDHGANLESHSSPSRYSDGEYSALCRAVYGRHRAVVSELLVRGADVDRPNPDGEPALFGACQLGLVDITRSLLQAGADANFERPDWRGGNTTPLIMCSAGSRSTEADRAEVAKLLVHHGADINAHSNGRTVALWAVEGGNIPLLRLYMDGELGPYQGLSRQQLEANGLLAAAEEGQEETIRFLIGRGFDPNVASPSGWTALHFFAMQGTVSAVDYLLSAPANADPNARLVNNMTAIHVATVNGHKRVVARILEDPRTDTTIKDVWGRTALMCATDKSIAELLSPARIDTNTLSPTALQACKETIATVFEVGRSALSEALMGSPPRVSNPSIYELLYGWNLNHDDVSDQGASDQETSEEEGQEKKVQRDSPTVSTIPRDGIKWIHLPANNLAWLQTLIGKAWIERDCKNIGSFHTIMNCLDNSNRTSSKHANYLLPSCHIIRGPPSDFSYGDEQAVWHQHTGSSRQHKLDSADEQNEKTKLALFLPYLHYDTVDGYDQMRRAINKVGGKSPSSSTSEAAVQGYLHDNIGLHPRRTIDQFFYPDVQIAASDLDVVVIEEDKVSKRNNHIFLVDQLWLVVLDDLVITSFPGAWEQQPRNDAVSVLGQAIKHVQSTKFKGSQEYGGPTVLAYDLAVVMANSCVNAFDSSMENKSFHFLPRFQEHFSMLLARQTKVLDSFRDTSKGSQRLLQNQQKDQQPLGLVALQIKETDTILDALLDVSEETSMMAELKKIQDELGVIAHLIDLQLTVLTKFEGHVQYALDKSHLLQAREQQQQPYGYGGQPYMYHSAYWQQQQPYGYEQQNFKPTPENPTLTAFARVNQRFRDMLEQVRARKTDIGQMQGRADDTYTSLRALLELKQMQSNALEAKFARHQAISAAVQGQTMLVFTTVTVFFLPITFIATIFTIGFQEWEAGEGGSRLTIPFVFKYVFGVGLAVSIPLVMLAFTAVNIVDAAKATLAFAKLVLCSRPSRWTQGTEGSSV